MVEVELNAIKETVMQVAEAIATVVKMDVTIVNEQKRRIAATGKYRNRVDKHIATDSIFTKVLEEGSNLVITDTQNSEYCKGCSAKENCVELAHVCCPIYVENAIVGLISLVAFSEKQRRLLLNNQDQYINFITKMALLIAGELNKERAKEKLFIQKKQLEAIVDSVSDGIIAIDNSGVISFGNKNAEALLGLNQIKLVNNHITNLIPAYKLQVKKSTQTVFYKNNNTQTYMLISSIPVATEANNMGAVLTLRSIKEIYEMANKVSTNNEISSFHKIVGKSNALKNAIKIAQKAALQDATILIQGESGTGKEIFARSIHQESPRRNKPFIAINCAAIPENLLESELFGYEEGAFTGTKAGGKPGKIELAHGGTIFLDEIGDMPLNLQVKLLRFLQDNVIEPLGGTRSKFVNVRIIAATNKNLDNLMQAGHFREDLYYRLSVVPIEVPALRDRREDINLLIDFFLNKYSQLYQKRLFSISDDARDILNKYNWPGNIRELENCIEYAVNIVSGTYIDVDNLPKRIKDYFVKKEPLAEKIELMPLAEMEKRLLELAWEKYGRFKEATIFIADELQISRASVYRKLKKYGINADA